MPHRIGIIGLGTVGSRFVEQFTAHPDFEVVAAWDADPDACATHANSVRIADDALEVVEEADAVYIAVPPLFHREYVDACVRAGTGIFCEKPLGVDLDESRAMVQLVEQSGLPAAVNFVVGSAPSAVQLAADVEAGRLGEIVRADLRLHFAEWPRAWHSKAQWLRFRDQGGWLREVASHFLFLARRALGPIELGAASVTFEDGVDGHLCEIDATARFTSSTAPLVMIGTSGGVGPDVVDLTIRGTHGSERIVDWYRLQSTTGGEWADRLGTDRAQLGSVAYAAQLGQLSLLLDGSANSLATFADALAVQELIEATLLGR